ncbi:hypothetical protein GWI33_014539 [Rhynchophorus ferrugineus]|uniref:Uncharacterized protein n=1 Tax=Rhynchophorus ferrugineus TaxID=354439 RepID=A0A834I4Z6_RHYFE|nr:hypothetical protein GWI33_014539 [Rhynchophorus ferrugineus]
MEKIEYRAVIKFLFLEGVAPKQIHERLLKVYKDSTPSVRTDMLSEDRRLTERDLAEALGISLGSVSNIVTEVLGSRKQSMKQTLDGLCSIGQVKLLNTSSDLSEEPPPVRREDLIQKGNKRFAADENVNPTKQMKRHRESPSLNPIAQNNFDESEPVKATENYNITNMPFGDLEYLTKSESEQSDTLSNLIQGEVIEPLVEIKIEQSD